MRPGPSRARRLAGGTVVTTALTLLLAGCGDGGDGGDGDTGDDSPTPGPTAARSTVPPGEPNGVADLPAPEVLAAAQEALRGADSVRITGGSPPEVPEADRVTLDLVFSGGDADAFSEADGITVDVVRVGDTAYLRGDLVQTVVGLGVDPTQCIGDSYVETSASEADLDEFSVEAFADSLSEDEATGEVELEDEVEERELDGQPVVVLSRADGSGEIYVAATGEPYPLRLVGTGDGDPLQAGEVRLSDFNEDLVVEAPEDVVPAEEARERCGGEGAPPG